MKKAALPLIALALSGCVIANQQNATQGKTALIGKTKSQILSCAGIPQSSYIDGSNEYFGYGAQGLRRSNVTADHLGGGFVLFSGTAAQSQCIVTMTLTGGVVTAVNYQSSGGTLIAPDEACGSVVRSCLR